MQNEPNIIQNHLAVRMFGVFEEVGGRQALADSPEGLTISELSEKLAVSKKLLAALIEYLRINLPSVLSEANGRLVLGPDAKNPAFRNVVHFSLAYEPILTHLASLLTGSITYGVEINRRGNHLQISSELYNSMAWDLMIDMLAAINPNAVIDLGCGSGRLLLRVKRTLPEALMLGIEADAQVAEAAQTALAGKGEVLCADVRKPEEWAGRILSEVVPNECAFLAITVWHEFLADGDQNAISLLTRYRSLFTGAKFFMVEYNGLTVDEMAALPSPRREWAALYQLVHPFTNQGVPPKPHVWKKIFAEAGLTLHQTVSVKHNLSLFTATF